MQKLGKIAPDDPAAVMEESTAIAPTFKRQTLPTQNTSRDMEPEKSVLTGKTPGETRRDRNGKIVRTSITDEDPSVLGALGSTPFRKNAQSSSSAPAQSSYSSSTSYAHEGSSSSSNGDRNHNDVVNDYTDVDASTALEDSFNGMLMAWYHSGYATGRYQALLEQSKKSGRSQNQNFHGQNFDPPFQPPHLNQNQNQNQQQNFRQSQSPQQPNPGTFYSDNHA